MSRVLREKDNIRDSTEPTPKPTEAPKNEDAIQLPGLSADISKAESSNAEAATGQTVGETGATTPDSIPLPPPHDAAPPVGKPDDAPKASGTRVEDTINRVPDEELPSHRERQRWDFSKQISKIMDEVLPKLAQVTHKVNTYTGTDYSSIEALRREIKEQGTYNPRPSIRYLTNTSAEQLVKARRAAIEESKQALDAAHAQQAASRKEVVALLERKHSWSAADLERYMSLIRSEHLDDQAVREAKEAVNTSESALEEARAQLEKRERAQYHEEQIWSDTIRRNSTWVTFGLMGVNIFLLLLSLAILEPWRRRRMVREIKTALEAHKPAVPVAAAVAAVAAQPTTAMIEEAIDEVIEPAPKEEEAKEQDPEIVPETAPAAASPSTPPKEEKEDIDDHSPTAPEPFKPIETPSSETDAYETANPATEPSAPSVESLAEAEAVAATDIQEELRADLTWLEFATSKYEELKSEDLISLRKKDLTAAVLSSAALGCAVASFVSLVLNWSR